MTCSYGRTELLGAAAICVPMARAESSTSTRVPFPPGPEIACVSDGIESAVRALVARLEALLNAAEIPRSLADCGVPRDSIPMLAAEAAKQWTANFNPRAVSTADFVGLYEAAFERRGDGDGLI